MASSETTPSRSTTVSTSSTEASVSASPGNFVEMPAMIYGTAWKKDLTAHHVYEAIQAGFRGIDTAAMREHYNEVGAGDGIRRAIRQGLVSRDQLWVSSAHR
jgi:diketogulonate reductase-like aldo/keto reductase